nr:hypothetical protein [Tanacetum cinerariifolium]
MGVRVPPAMSPGLSASIAEVAAMSDSTFCKRFRSSYDSSPSPTFLVRKMYREDEGPTAEDEDPAAGGGGLAARDEGFDMGVASPSLGGDEAVPEGQQWAAPVMETVLGEPLGLGYGALRHREIALRESRMPNVFEIDPKDGIAYIDVPAYPPPAPPVQTPPSLEWTFGSLPISPLPFIVPSPISSPIISLTVPSSVASPTTAEAEGFLTRLGAQVEMHGGLIRDHTAALQRELQEMKGRVTALEQERELRERVVLRFSVLSGKFSRV